jgi:prepilin-type N-terminal cleavage/methylation domain-containing protein
VTTGAICQPDRFAPAGHRPARRVRRAFTLLELILVMLILSVLFAMVAPSLSGFGAGREAEYAGAQLMTLSHWAREQAIAEGRVYRLNFDATKQGYWLTRRVGGTYQRFQDEFGDDFPLPEGVEMAWTAPQEAGAYVIDFDPTGRATPVRIQVRARTGQVTIIGNRTATEMLRVLTPQEAAG